MTPSKCRLIPLTLSLLVSSLAMAQERAFVQIGSIVGDSTDPAHSGWIDGYALDNKLYGPPPPVGGGSGGRATFEDYAILKAFDSTSPVLNQGLASGTNYPNAVIEVCRVGTPTQECYLRIELTNVQIATLNISGSVCGASGSCTPSVTESLTLRYHKIAWIFTPYVGGEAGTPVRRCFNVDTNASCP